MKIRRTWVIVCLLSILFVPASGREWMADPNFQFGLALSPLSPLIVQKGGGFGKTNTDTLRFCKNANQPVWQVAQWWSQYDLAHTKMQSSKYGMGFMNEGKQIIRDKKGVLTLAIQTSSEYKSARREGEQWPHLLIQQDFKEPLMLKEIHQLILSFGLRLLYCRNKMKKCEFNPGLHTAQSPFYLYLRNVNKKSAQCGSSLWLGVPSFDYRDERLNDEPVVSWDLGTSMYIYQMPPRKLWGYILFTDTKWHKLRADLLPFIHQAVDYLHAKGLFLNTSTEDLMVSGMNFGWEVPGTFDAALQVKQFSLISKP